MNAHHLGVHRIGPGAMSGVSCHLLVEGEGARRTATLIDSGFGLHHLHLRWLMRRLGLPPDALKAVLQTHAHLDHAGRLHEIRAWSGAATYLHEADVPILSGAYPYCGWARVCGVMERVGRVALRYHVPTIDHPLAHGDELPFWGGLRVVGLPGHTEGHVGFYSKRHDLLFAGDLVAAFGVKMHLSPAIFNAKPELYPVAFERVRELSPRRVVLNHYLRLDMEKQAKRLDAFAERYLRTHGARS